MKVKLSNRILSDNAEALSELSQKELPVKVSYAIAKNMTKIQSELKVYNEQRGKLVDKYADKDEQGKTKMIGQNQILIQPENVENWAKDINDLLDIEIELDIHQFPLALLDNSSMKPAEFMAIDYMIEE